MNEREMVRRVRERAALPADAEAERALTAVVAALAARLTYGEAHDLTDYLPAGLREAILLSLAPMAGLRFRPLEDLYDEVALQLELPAAEAAHRVRAVGEVLAEALPPAHLRDVVGQLPRSLRPLFDQGLSTAR